MVKTIGVVAHVDAGKTTLLEQILCISSAIRQAGRVDKKNTVLDYHAIERDRGITVFSDQARITYKTSEFNIVDTPGHVDFSSEMERAVRILDCAVVIISAAEGIQGHTETVWQLLRKYGVPTVFFINKLDRVGADFDGVCQKIRASLTQDLCVLAEPKQTLPEVKPLFSSSGFTSEVMEVICEKDDALLEKYLDGKELSYDELSESLSRNMSACNIYPCLCGSGLKNTGVDTLLDFLDTFVRTSYDKDGQFGGIVYKITHDENNLKQTHIKVLSGTLSVRDTITHRPKNSAQGLSDILESSEITEKVTQIKVCTGAALSSVNSLSAGECGILYGTDGTFIGEGLGLSVDMGQFFLQPVLKVRAVFKDDDNLKEIVNIFRMLNDEDPSLNVEWVESLGQLHINVMGVIQIEILKSVIAERFGKNIEFEKPEVVYKETIKAPCEGFGHFEPYRHYAEVKLRMTPTLRDTGLSYSSSVNHDALHPRWQKTILKLIEPACGRGVLTGSPVTDMHIELIKGSAHVKHTAGGDFHQAVFRAVRHGLENAECLLLEPIYRFKITVEQSLAGRVMNDIIRMCGSFDSPEVLGANCIIRGRVPVASAMDYPSELMSFTKGRGALSFDFNGYDICHNALEVIERYGYDSTADIEYTSNSIYCNKGSVYSIPGNEAESYRRG